uniref:Origin recognition complex subunit 1 n=1 Tax=Esox lucius TaxID=8010 RepID=A0A6Q2X6N0_ESOLU
MQHSVQSRCKIMVRYFTRLRVRRVYKWDGTPSSFDRKLKTYFFDSLNISVEGQPGMTTVTPGQYVLIEGDNEDNPFVAKLLKFFGDGESNSKKALVQWFVRVCEVPHNKKKLLGRSPHPQEVFYYLGHTCDNEIDAESILNTVQIVAHAPQVQYVPVDAPFPEPGIKDTLYVKLSWDTKTFKDLDPALMQDTPVPASTPPRLKPASPCSPPAAALVSLGSVGRGVQERRDRGEDNTGKASQSLHHPCQDSTQTPQQEGWYDIDGPYSAWLKFQISHYVQNSERDFYFLLCFLFQATPSTPRTPRTPRHATPSIPSRTLPARKPGNVLEEARARLHVSSVPESLPCREQEFQDIYNFVESKVMDGTGGCMYISGVPGTGKTATVHEVIRCLQHASDMDEIPTFRFVEINGMKMTDPHQAYVQILQKLTDQKATADHAAALLEKMFSNPAPKKETTVLLVDELDLLWTRKQNVMYNLFDWPTRRHARLVVLTIANTMDLPERIMINRVASRLGLTRMSFQPYSFKQLQQIITSRLNKVKAFEEDALQLVSRKVAALSGDARRCLDICRRATEICEHSAPQPSSTGLVGMSHVMEALDEMFSSSYITAIRCASVQEQLFLRAVLAEFRRLGLEEATFQQVFVQHRALCRVEGLQPLSVSEGLAVCQRLGACRLLLLEASRLDVLQRVRLNVSQDDVLYALKADRA